MRTACVFVHSLWGAVSCVLLASSSILHWVSLGLRSKKDFRLPLVVALLVSITEMIVQIQVPETLPPGPKRIPLKEAAMDWRRSNPLSFVRLFLHGPQMTARLLTDYLLTESGLPSGSAACTQGSFPGSAWWFAKGI